MVMIPNLRGQRKILLYIVPNSPVVIRWPHSEARSVNLVVIWTQLSRHFHLAVDSPPPTPATFFCGTQRWQRCLIPLEPFDADDPIPARRARLLAAVEGYAGEAPGYET